MGLVWRVMERGVGIDLCLRREMKGEVEGQVVRGVSWDGEGKEGGVT